MTRFELRAAAAFCALAALAAGCDDGAAGAPLGADAAAEATTDVAPDVSADVEQRDASDATTDLADAADATHDAPSNDAAPDAALDATPDVAPDASSDVAPDAAPDAAPDVALDALPDAALDARADVALDVAPDAPADVAPDAPPDVARPDASPDVAPAGCTSNAECGTGLCLVGRCARYTDESLPLDGVPSPDRCRMRVGVDFPTGAPLRLLTVVPSTSGDTGYESVRTGSSWTRRTLSTNVSRYSTPRFQRTPPGALEVSFVQGTSVSLGARGGVTQSGFSDYEAAYSPTGELAVVVKHQGTGTFSYPYPVRLWRMTGATWASDLVTPSVGTDGGAALHYRADGTPDVLTFGPTSATLYRKALDVWSGTSVYAGPGTHAGGVIALHDPRGGTHVVFGTRVFTIDASIGELTLEYFYVASDGTVARRERLPVGGHGFTFLDATLAADNSVYVMVTGPVSGGRYPTHVVRVGPSNVSSSVVANFETSTTACSLAVAPDGTMYLAAYQGYARPVLLRTYAP